MKQQLQLLLCLALLLISARPGFAQTSFFSVNDGAFESGATFPLNNWTVLNGTYPARVWQVGTGAGFVGTAAAFSGNSPSTVGTNNVATIVHFYRTVTIPAGTEGLEFTFAYKQPTTDVIGATIYDGMEINLQAAPPIAGTRAATVLFRQGAFAYAAFTNLIGTLDATPYAGTTQTLVFTFFSDAVAPVANVAVDNIAVKYTSCRQPSGVSASSITSTTATINWAPPPTSPTNFDIFYSSSAGVPSFTTTATVTAATGSFYNATGLAPSTTYYVWVRSNCGGTKSLWTAMPSFTTACATPTARTATLTAGGTTSTNWGALPWVPTGLPTPCDNVTITYSRTAAGSPSAIVILDRDVNINSLTLVGAYGSTGSKLLQASN